MRILLNYLRLAVLGLVLVSALAVAQVVPDQYVVELQGAPLGMAVRQGGRAAHRLSLAKIYAEQARLKAVVERTGGKVLGATDSLLNSLIVNIPDAQAGVLESLPGVKKVYPVYWAQANLDHALPLHKVPDSWALIGGQDNAGAGIKIGILDTGITPDHPAFNDPSLTAPAGFPKASSTANMALTNSKIIVARSYEDLYQETTPDSARDLAGHGTSVAMCAAGVTNKGPYATITGVAPKAWIGGYKIVPGNTGSASGAVIIKALDDALADGMDVVNLSFGSPFQFGPDTLAALAVARLTQAGVVFVTSNGNSGPGFNTVGSYASEPTAISVGASQNDRYLGAGVTVGGRSPLLAVPAAGSNSSPITSTLFDVSSVDPSGLLCSPLPAGSASGQIAFILRGTCTFEVKVNNAQAGGAIAALIYTAPSSPAPVIASLGSATLPTVMINNSDGVAVKAQIAADPTATATLTFGGISFPQDSSRMATFSSRGPNYDFTIKPDLTAVGTDVYSAAQSTDPTGDVFSANGYLSVDGTSFSSPITAGAAAVLRGYRPGLTVDQYRSLIINGANPLAHPDGSLERIQSAGAGTLNLVNALQNTVTAKPTSLSYLTGSGTLNTNQPVALTNISAVQETYSIYSIAYDTAPPLQFSIDGKDASPTTMLNVTIDPGQTTSVYAFWKTATPLSPGEYQGQIIACGNVSSTCINMPYWYGVPIGLPTSVFYLSTLPTSGKVGTTINVYFRVTDDIGSPVTDTAALNFKGTVAAGGGTVTLSPTVFFPNQRLVQFKLGPTAGTNAYSISIGSLAPATFTFTGTP